MTPTPAAGSEATRSAILLAAARRFDRDGYAGTSVSAVSRDAGLTTGAVYFHFAGKEGLARSVVEEHFAAWPDVVARVSGRAGPALDKIIVLSYEVARAFRDDILVRAGSRLWTERKDIGTPLPRPFVGWIDLVAGLIRDGRADGSVDAAVTPRIAASVLVCAFFGTHTVSDALDDRLLIERRLDHLWLMFLPGLRKDAVPEEVLRAALAEATEAGA